jgi:serine-type D-Ala-D-Ala carboxypeptidase (penicillin-binding protein 5/6)
MRFVLFSMLIALFSVPAPAHAQPFETKASQALLIDAETGTILFSKDPDQPVPPASLAKLMTMEVVFHALKTGNISLDDTFTVSENAWRKGGAPSGGSTMFAALKSKIQLRDLIQGVIVQSANDGCIIIAEGMAGDEEKFVALMNERARQIGLKGSVFKNTSGLPAEGQKVTMRDLVTLAAHIWREYPEFYKHYAQPDFTWNKILQRNRNPLLNLGIGADGMGTGFTEESGYAIVASASSGDRRVFAAMGGMKGDRERAEEARKLLVWSMQAFEKAVLFGAGEVVGEAAVYGGSKADLALRAERPVAAYIPSADGDSVSARIVYDGPLLAPVEEGTRVGKLEVRVAGMLSQETPLYAAESVPLGAIHQRALDAVKELLTGWMRSESSS